LYNGEVRVGLVSCNRSHGVRVAMHACMAQHGFILHTLLRALYGWKRSVYHPLAASATPTPRAHGGIIPSTEQATDSG